MKRSTRIVSLVLTIFLFSGFFSVHASAAGTELKTGIAFVDASSLRLRYFLLHMCSTDIDGKEQL